MNSIADELTGHRFFAGMDVAHLELLAGCGRNIVIPGGESIIREGTHADQFWALRSGRVALGVMVPARGMRTIETLHAGDVLGWAWLFPPYRWHFDARAVDGVRAIAFDGACLRGKCEEDTRLGYALMQRFAAVMIDRLQHTRFRLLDVYGGAAVR